MRTLYVVSICVLLMVGPAGAALVDSVSFASDGEIPNPKTITLDSFDTTTGCGPGQWRQLNVVTVTTTYEGSASLIADNDDGFNDGKVKGRIIRTWILDGPGLSGITSTKTVLTGEYSLGADDGDGTVVDPTAPDGTDFGGSPVSFTGEPGVLSPYTPAVALYETSGPGSVVFNITADTIVNDLVWTEAPEGTWQLEVADSKLKVTVAVAYDWTCVPEPSTMIVLALGAGLMLLKRKRQ